MYQITILNQETNKVYYEKVSSPYLLRKRLNKINFSRKLLVLNIRNLDLY